MTKTEEKEELKKLRRKCLLLWTKKVKETAGNQCEARENKVRCKEVKFLHAHHIESYSVNRNLRHDPKNGMCLCAGHHKFKRKSAQKSFVFMFEQMTQYNRQNDLQYLIEQSNVTNPETKESLLAIIEKLSSRPQLIRRLR